MTTTQLPAEYVLSIADERIAELRLNMAVAREEKIVSFMNKPIRRGCLWWRYDHYRTRAEAEAVYIAPSDLFCGNAQYRTERDFKHTIRALKPLKMIAEATIEAGQSFVTIDPSDCYILGIPRSAA